MKTKRIDVSKQRCSSEFQNWIRFCEMYSDMNAVIPIDQPLMLSQHSNKAAGV